MAGRDIQCERQRDRCSGLHRRVERRAEPRGSCADRRSAVYSDASVGASGPSGSGPSSSARTCAPDNADSVTDANAKSVAGANTESFADSNTHAVADSNTHTVAHASTDSFAVTNTSTHADAESVADAHAESVANANTVSVAEPHTDAQPVADTDTESAPATRPAESVAGTSSTPAASATEKHNGERNHSRRVGEVSERDVDGRRHLRGSGRHNPLRRRQMHTAEEWRRGYRQWRFRRGWRAQRDVNSDYETGRLTSADRVRRCSTQQNSLRALKH